jgi:hypothetical protein
MKLDSSPSPKEPTLLGYADKKNIDYKLLSCGKARQSAVFRHRRIFAALGGCVALRHFYLTVVPL